VILLNWWVAGKVVHVFECAPRHERMWRIKCVFNTGLGLTLGGGERAVSCDTCFTSEKVAPDTHITEWVDPRAGLFPLSTPTTDDSKSTHF